MEESHKETTGGEAGGDILLQIGSKRSVNGNVWGLAAPGAQGSVPRHGGNFNQPPPGSGI